MEPIKPYLLMALVGHLYARHIATDMNVPVCSVSPSRPGLVDVPARLATGKLTVILAFSACPR